jgi:hypothetical protein
VFGIKLKQARRYMADPDFKRNFDGALAGYRASLAPGNIAVALSIRDDESIEPKARLKACEYLDGPRPLANGVQVNVTQNNNTKTTVLPGYVIKLNDPAAEPKTIEHQAETPIVPAKSGNVGDAQRDLKAEKAEAEDLGQGSSKKLAAIENAVNAILPKGFLGSGVPAKEDGPAA